LIPPDSAAVLVPYDFFVDIYTHFLRPLLFNGLNADPEYLHQQALNSLAWLSTHRHNYWGQLLLQQIALNFVQTDPRLSQTVWGLSFSNPVGLAAGFDKDGIGAAIWHTFGFGFAELGTVTQHPQPGNPRPRLFRLLKDQAVLNRMGFNNAGSAMLAERLTQLFPSGENLGHPGRNAAALGQNKNHGTNYPIPLGINLGKSKITPLAEADTDYLVSFKRLHHLGDYFVVNVSSPNTPGLRSLQAIEQLEPIIVRLQQENHNGVGTTHQSPSSNPVKPLFLKIAPDLSREEISAIVDLAKRLNLTGIIATNTTIRRDGLQTTTLPGTTQPIQEELGGISGAPLRRLSTEMIRFIWQESNGQLPIIGVGGIATAADAWEKITAGATLVQVYTGWIYQGPWLIGKILQGLGERLTHEGLTHISQAVGMMGLTNEKDD
jgi:dihydroorotate dehydrogenase